MLDGVDVDPFPHLERWLDAVGQRPATLKAFELAKSYNKNAMQPPSPRSWRSSGPQLFSVITTSQQNGRNPEPGGNPKGLFAIRGDGKDWFAKDTWLLFEEPLELSGEEFMKALQEKTITVKGQLRGDLTNRICNCMKRCDDVSEYHRSLLGPPIQPKKAEA